MFNEARVDGALAASVFHTGALAIPELKRFLRDAGDRGTPMKLDQVTALDWDKSDGLLPAIVQDARSGQVLMLAYMNREALRITLAEKRVTFFSRSRNKLWTKGESSGHWLHVVDVETDCDHDTLLVLANPEGPTCHTGTRSCFGDEIETRCRRTCRS